MGRGSSQGLSPGVPPAVEGSLATMTALMRSMGHDSGAWGREMTATQIQEKHVTVNGVRLRYFDYGNEDKMPMVCLHGHTGQAHIWDEFAEAMAQHFHVVTVDQRGHGESEHASTGYARDRFVEDLDEFVVALGFDRFVLVGLSMGGWHSLLYTGEKHPEKVERIVIVDIGPEPSEESKAQSGSRPPTPMSFSSVDEAVTWARSGNPWASDDRLRQDIEDKLKKTADGSWTWKADAALFNVPLADGTDETLINRYWAALRTIEQPILEVRGLDSPLLDDTLKDKMIAESRNMSWVDVPDAGHVVTVDKPQEFIAATRAFLGV